MNSTFKVGDIVMCTMPKARELTLNCNYTVIAVPNDESDNYVVVKNDKGLFIEYLASRFTIVSSQLQPDISTTVTTTHTFRDWRLVRKDDSMYQLYVKYTGHADFTDLGSFTADELQNFKHLIQHVVI